MTDLVLTLGASLVGAAAVAIWLVRARLVRCGGTLWAAAQTNKGLTTLVIVTGLACAYYLVAQANAVYIQPDPQVLSLPLAWQKEAAPVPNAGVDAAGLTLDQWIAKGNAAKDYQPVRKVSFKQGESLWTLRYECFLYKTQDATVSRAFLGGDGAAGTNRSAYTLPDVQIPTRTDGCAVKNHRTPIPADLPPGVWTYQATANFYKNPMQPSVRVLFKPVVVEVTR